MAGPQFHLNNVPWKECSTEMPDPLLKEAAPLLQGQVHDVSSLQWPTALPEGMQASNDIEAVIFDKDGTLFDFQATWGAWCTGMIEVEASGDQALGTRIADVLGYDLVSHRFHPDSVIAEPTEVLAERLLPLLSGACKADIVARMDERAAKAPQVEAAPLRALLMDLSRRGLHLGLATNDVEASTRAHLRAAGIEGLFDFIACLDSGWGAKPQPGQLLAAARALDVEPEHCVMIGDSLHDLHAARAAGMRAVAVLTGLTARETLEPVADVVLGSIKDLPRWIAVH